MLNFRLQLFVSVHFFLMLRLQLLLDIIHFVLYVVERPLLRFLHLYHHFLYLLKLLKVVCLHLFDLLLLRYKHFHAAALLVLAKECVLDRLARFVFAELDREPALRVLLPALVEFVGRLRGLSRLSFILGG